MTTSRLGADLLALRALAKTPFEIPCADLLVQMAGLIAALQLQMRVLSQTPVDR